MSVLRRTNQWYSYMDWLCQIFSYPVDRTSRTLPPQWRPLGLVVPTTMLFVFRGLIQLGRMARIIMIMIMPPGPFSLICVPTATSHQPCASIKVPVKVPCHEIFHLCFFSQKNPHIHLMNIPMPVWICILIAEIFNCDSLTSPHPCRIWSAGVARRWVKHVDIWICNLESACMNAWEHVSYLYVHDTKHLTIYSPSVYSMREIYQILHDIRNIADFLLTLKGQSSWKLLMIRCTAQKGTQNRIEAKISANSKTFS
jgi:hypothetical protein